MPNPRTSPKWRALRRAWDGYQLISREDASIQSVLTTDELLSVQGVEHVTRRHNDGRREEALRVPAEVWRLVEAGGTIGESLRRAVGYRAQGEENDGDFRERVRILNRHLKIYGPE